jgi:DNA-binding transcriptional ArsR family regulator
LNQTEPDVKRSLQELQNEAAAPAARTVAVRYHAVVFTSQQTPRLRQILQLQRRGETTAGEPAEHFDRSKPSLSHHVAVLKQADLIEARREGQAPRCAAVPSTGGGVDRSLTT